MEGYHLRDLCVIDENGTSVPQFLVISFKILEEHEADKENQIYDTYYTDDNKTFRKFTKQLEEKGLKAIDAKSPPRTLAFYVLRFITTLKEPLMPRQIPGLLLANYTPEQSVEARRADIKKALETNMSGVHLTTLVALIQHLNKVSRGKPRRIKDFAIRFSAACLKCHPPPLEYVELFEFMIGNLYPAHGGTR